MGAGEVTFVRSVEDPAWTEAFHDGVVCDEISLLIVVPPELEGYHLEGCKQMPLAFVVEALAVLVDHDAVVVAPLERSVSRDKTAFADTALTMTASGLVARLSTSSQCMPSNEPAVAAPSSSAIFKPAPLLYFKPGAINGNSWVRLPTYLASISWLPSKPPHARTTSGAELRKGQHCTSLSSSALTDRKEAHPFCAPAAPEPLRAQ